MATGIAGLIALALMATVGRPSAAAVAAAPAAGGSLCAPGERPLFACPLGRKRAEVCSAGRQAVYRYGMPGAIELTSRTLILAETGYSGGGETQIQVASKDYRYILFDRTVRTAFGSDGHHDADSTSGLLVRHAGKTLLSKACDDDAAIPRRAADVMPSGGTILAH